MAEKVMREPIEVGMTIQDRLASLRMCANNSNIKSVKFTNEGEEEEEARQPLSIQEAVRKEISTFEERFGKMNGLVSSEMVKDFLLKLRSIVGNKKDRLLNGGRNESLNKNISSSSSSSSSRSEKNREKEQPVTINRRQSILKNSSYNNGREVLLEEEEDEEEEESPFNANIVNSPSHIGLDTPDKTGPAQSSKSPAAQLTWPRVLSLLHSPNMNDQMTAVHAIRKSLTGKGVDSGHLQNIVDSSILERLVGFLGDSLKPDLQFEALWALTNIAASEHTQLVVEAGAVPLLVKLLSSNVIDIREQAVWALGNIIGDGPDTRDYAIQCGVLEPLLKLLEPKLSKRIDKKTVIWAISNIFRDVVLSSYAPSILEQCLPAVNNVLKYVDESVDALLDILEILMALTDKNKNESIQNYQNRYIVDAEIIPSIIYLLSTHEDNKVVVYSLKVLGNLLIVSDEMAERILNYRVLDYFQNLLMNEDLNIIKNAMFFLSNVAAGPPEHIQALIDDGAILSLIREHMEMGAISAKKEASWTVRNIILTASLGQVKCLFEAGVVEAFAQLLSSDDDETAFVVCQGIHCLLKNTSTCRVLQRSREWPKINELLHRPEMLHHRDVKISKLVRHIVGNMYLYGKSGAEEDSENDSDRSQFLRR